MLLRPKFPTKYLFIFYRYISGAFLPLIDRIVERDWGNDMLYRSAQSGGEPAITASNHHHHVDSPVPTPIVSPQSPYLLNRVP